MTQSMRQLHWFIGAKEAKNPTCESWIWQQEVFPDEKRGDSGITDATYTVISKPHADNSNVGPVSCDNSYLGNIHAISFTFLLQFNIQIAVDVSALRIEWKT